MPKNTDIAKTIANDEWIISEKLASIISDHKITGITIKPVQHSSSRNLKSKWYQMIVTATVNVSELTKYGDAFKPNLISIRLRRPAGTRSIILPYPNFIFAETAGTDLILQN
jgi:hypothetical protein